MKSNKYCSKCGERVPPNSAYCSDCGADLSTEATTGSTGKASGGNSALIQGLDLSPSRGTALLGAILLLIGSFLPWVDAGIVSVSGARTDGIVVLITAVILLALLMFASWDWRVSSLTAAAGGFTCLIALGFISNNPRLAESTLVSAGSGVYVSMIAGAILFFAGISPISQSKQIRNKFWTTADRALEQLEQLIR
ncbi:zinc ribbon domain-containing protein [Natronoarchaeum mannanilyticum]|uniref:zinc ribbon domain-containing protein n=1 Tax=Natronoarchaeum mannanilyticum TaxID=926360 RepID=UPI0031DC1556